MGQPATPRADTLGRLHGDQLAETLRRFTAAWQASPPTPRSRPVPARVHRPPARGTHRVDQDRSRPAPAFLPLGGAFGSDVEQLRALDRRSTYFLLLAAAVPLIGAAGATFLPAADIAEVRPALRVLLLGSALAFARAYLLFRTLEHDIAALERVVAHGIAPHAADSASTV